MTTVLAGILVILAVYAGRYVRSTMPVHSIKRLDQRGMQEMAQNDGELRLVDLRDYLDFERHSLPGSLSLPLGRLPFTWNRVLNKGNRVVLIDEDYSRIRTASRKLQRKGIEPAGYFIMGQAKRECCTFGTCA